MFRWFGLPVKSALVFHIAFGVTQESLFIPVPNCMEVVGGFCFKILPLSLSVGFDI